MVTQTHAGQVQITRKLTVNFLFPLSSSLSLSLSLSLSFSPSLSLSVSLLPSQAYQRDDPRKYSVATVLIRVLAVNRFPPQFDRAAYRGFVMEGNSPVSLVNTYGNTVLMLHVQDQDFTDVCARTHRHTHKRTHSHSV